MADLPIISNCSSLICQDSPQIKVFIIPCFASHHFKFFLRKPVFCLKYIYKNKPVSLMLKMSLVVLSSIICNKSVFHAFAVSMSTDLLSPTNRKFEKKNVFPFIKSINPTSAGIKVAFTQA